jgi:nuclear transport factor 2 (NTF2) superfamily protein
MSTRPPLPPFTHETAVLKVGFAPSAMRIGNSTTTVLCVCAWRISMIFRLENQSANIIGPWAAAQIITRG